LKSEAKTPTVLQKETTRPFQGDKATGNGELAFVLDGEAAQRLEKV